MVVSPVLASSLGFVGNFQGDRSVCCNEVAVDGFAKALGRVGNALVLELDLALSALVVSGANILVVDLQR